MQYNINRYIKDSIRLDGPLSLDKFIFIASSYYYSHNSSIGQSNDFVTAPEISQMFGEVIALYLSDIWYRKMQNSVTIVELGPGNGTMMFDILRTIESFQDLYQNVDEIALIETSPLLIKNQQETLKAFQKLNINWYQGLTEVKGKNFFIVANEFLDALPIKQFYYNEGKFYEVVVTLNEENDFVYGLSASRFCTSDLADRFKNNQFIEISFQREEYIDIIANKIAGSKGYALIIDYGYLIPPNKSTLQAVMQHEKVKIFDYVGSADITSLVDFISLQTVLSKSAIESKVTTQKDFLLKFGILQRAEMLIRAGATREKIQYQMKKLTLKEEMGQLFKVMITK